MRGLKIVCFHFVCITVCNSVVITGNEALHRGLQCNVDSNVHEISSDDDAGNVTVWQLSRLDPEMVILKSSFSLCFILVLIYWLMLLTG